MTDVSPSRARESVCGQAKPPRGRATPKAGKRGPMTQAGQGSHLGVGRRTLPGVHQTHRQKKRRRFKNDFVTKASTWNVQHLTIEAGLGGFSMSRAAPARPGTAATSGEMWGLAVLLGGTQK